jgi:hypothetical protein
MLTVDFRDEMLFFGGRRKESGQVALGTYEDLEPEFSFRTALTQVQNFLFRQNRSTFIHFLST